MKDAAQEAELLASGDEQYEHLNEPLHVVITLKAPRIEAHRRLATACRELNKFMGPVNEEVLVLGAAGGGTVLMEHPSGHQIPAGREIIMPAATAPQPQIMFGIPPPGAIILNDNPAIHMADDRSRAPPPRRESYPSYGKQAEGGGSWRGGGEKRSSGGGSSSYQTKRFKKEESTVYPPQSSYGYGKQSR